MKIDFESKYVKKKRRRHIHERKDLRIWRMCSLFAYCLPDTYLAPANGHKRNEKKKCEKSKYGTMRLPHHRHHRGRRLSHSIEACSRAEWIFSLSVLCWFVCFCFYCICTLHCPFLSRHRIHFSIFLLGAVHAFVVWSRNRRVPIDIQAACET